MNLPEYPEYKDSGVEWLGKVPVHWGRKKLKFLFKLHKRTVRKQDGIITCFRDGVVTLRTNRRTEGFTNALKEVGYQGVRRGDLVIHAMDAFAGAVGVSDSDGKSSPVYSVCSPISTGTSPYYYGRLLRHMALSGYVESLAKGIRERSTDFRWSDAAKIYLPVPTCGEQSQIAAFLDHETARIDALIEEQKKLIELLKEKRQAVISHAVTKGLNPDAPMKDSGVEWLGQVPAHWAVMRLSYLVRQVTEKANKANFQVGLENINGWTGGFLEPAVKYSGDGIAFKENDLLFGKLRPYLAKVWLASKKGQAVGDFFVLRPKSIHGKFLQYFILTPLVINNLDSWTIGAKMPRVSWEDFSQLAISTPPLDEQSQIAAFLDHETARIDALTEEANTAIDLLQERRSALISAAVTGKIDVRGWSADRTAQSVTN